jgi:hypothetical protein
VLRAPATAAFSATDRGILAGMVRDMAGDPVEGVNFVIDGEFNTSTGSDGKYRFPPLAPGTHSLNASLPGWQPQTRPAVEIIVGQTTFVNLTFDAAAGSAGEIRGVVTDTAGAPVFAAFVNFGGGKATDTNESGVFRWLAAPGGWVNFTVTKAGHMDNRGTAFVPPNGVSRWANVTLVIIGGGGTGMVSGWVRDPVAGNAAIPGALVWVADIPSINNTTDSLGIFSLQGIPAGPHDILASARYFYTGNFSVEVEADVAKQVTIYLNQETMGQAALSGHVYDQQGRPVNGATVRIEGTLRMTGTGPDGAYGFDNATPGNYSVTASAPLLGSMTETDFNILAHTINTLDITLGPDRTFANTSLGVRVSGDFTGNGSFIIRAIASPEPLQNGIGVYFELADVGFQFSAINISYTNASLLNHNWSGRMYFWNNSGWVPCNRSGSDAVSGKVWANVTHLTIFGIAGAGHTRPTGGTIVVLPPWLSPVAVVAIVVLVGVPIGIIVIRFRRPPTGGGRQNAPAPPPPPQSGANL